MSEKCIDCKRLAKTLNELHFICEEWVMKYKSLGMHGVIYFENMRFR